MTTGKELRDLAEKMEALETVAGFPMYSDNWKIYQGLAEEVENEIKAWKKATRATAREGRKKWKREVLG